ncbi:MAG: hypothetical protein KDB60_15805 [Propionibacteriaceae bacterium]|nr:hypothetical protein [Propionibacteriaceae bacterium]
MSRSATEFLDALVARAADDLQGVDCAAPVCVADRANRPVAGVKHNEGRWAALRGVQREAGRGHDLAEAVDRARARWRADLRRHEERESGRHWIDYCVGGVEALDEFAEAVSTGSTSRGGPGKEPSPTRSGGPQRS